jgi:hypothetical protein
MSAADTLSNAGQQGNNARIDGEVCCKICFMASPEYSNLRIPSHSSREALMSALEAIDRRLEIMDGNENTIERYFIQDRLEELKAGIQEEVDELPPNSF